MKKIFAILMTAVAITAVCSCSKESGFINPDDQISVDTQLVELTFSADLNSMTKVALGESGKVSWEEGDAISIFDGVSNVQAVASNISDDGRTAEFNASVAKADTYYAVYPYNDASTFAAAVIGNSAITNPEQDGSFSMAHACAACTDAASRSFAFRNIISLLAFSTDRTDISSVEFVGANGEALCGAGSIAFGADGQPAFTQAADGGNAVVNIAKQSGTYYVGISPLALSNGFTINFYDGEVDSENLIGVINAAKPLNAAPGKVISLGNLDDHYDLSGSGAASDPWLIRCGYDMNLMRDKKAAQDTLTTEYYKVTRDIDLSAYSSWVPVDTRNAAYMIDFDGQDHTVRNMTITASPNYASLLGLVCGSVRNLNFEDCNVEVNRSHGAILAGWVGNNGGTLPFTTISNVNVKNCTVKHTAANGSGTGLAPLVGCAGYSKFENCSVEGCKVYRQSNSSNNTSNKESWTGGFVAATYGVTFENCSAKSVLVESMYDNRNVGGFVGKAMKVKDIYSSFSDCAFEGKVSSESDLCAGFAAWSGGGSFERCSAKCEVSVRAAGCVTSNTAYAYAGGLIGYVTSNVSISISDCSYEGTCKSVGKVIGGILGQNSASSATISGCTVKGEINGGQFVGGVTGYVQQGEYTLSDTQVNADIISATSLAGGMVGQINGGVTSVTACSHSGLVKAATTYVGGIIANTNTATGADVLRCSHAGDVKGTGCCAGIVGLAKATGSIVNSYSSEGTITGAMYCGGIVGDGGQTLTVENCYSSMNVNATYPMGGIVGRMTGCDNPNSKGWWQSQFADVLRGCIAWGNIKSTLAAGGQTPATGYSSGAVLGCTIFKNTLSNCWRKPDMEFQAYPADLDSYNTPVDQDDCGPSNPYVKLGPETYYMPYHGKAAGASETCSQVAARIGWDTSVWDLSGEFPVLK